MARNGAVVKSRTDPYPEDLTRRYVQRERAQRTAETRRRIVEAALQLHTTVGPLATTISDIAARAGVERPTVYRHFPSERRLLAACTSHFGSLHPFPDLSRIVSTLAGPERVEAALRALYAYYDRVGDLLIPIARDQDIDPTRLGSGMRDGLDHLTSALTSGWRLERRSKASVRSLIRLGLSVWTWRSLVREERLPSVEAARLMSRAVTSAVAKGGGFS